MSISHPVSKRIVLMNPAGLSLGRLLSSKNCLRFTRRFQCSTIVDVLSESVSSFVAMGWAGGLIQTAWGSCGAMRYRGLYDGAEADNDFETVPVVN